MKASSGMTRRASNTRRRRRAPTKRIQWERGPQYHRPYNKKFEQNLIVIMTNNARKKRHQLEIPQETT